AYESVVSRYRLSTIDLDLEGAALGSATVDARRAQAIHAAQETATAAHRRLAVWVTLPATPAGLSDQGVAAVRSMLAAHVDLAGVNVMTMDYGQSLPRGQGMLTGSLDALRAAQRQVAALYQQAGMPLSTLAAWGKIGATPMIGTNDSPGEAFTLADARGLTAFAQDHHLGRVSMWSLNRDSACSAGSVGASGSAGATMVSNHCSGVAQAPLAFSQVFAELTGWVDARPAARVSPTTSTPSVLVDNPATSPYPIWISTAAYPRGTKIVWHHEVYQAKWWAQGQPPDPTVAHPWQTPWLLLGPVLPGDHPYVPPPLPVGTYPAWSPTGTYPVGERVQLDGVGYQAKWWTRGDRPQPVVVDPATAPWQVLTPALPSTG
ncbi:MAG: carbohydrate-binding protein, partial [Actinomycetes bacterium]